MNRTSLKGLLDRSAKGVTISDSKILPNSPKASKYKNTKCEFGGYTFDSIKEMNRYKDLYNLQRSGHIKYLLLQVPFLLIPKSKGQKKCSYVADFVYINYQGIMVVEDVKPFSKKKNKYLLTATFIMKQKLMLERHNIEISLH